VAAGLLFLQKCLKAELKDIVNEDATHGARRHGQHMRLVLYLHAVHPHQADGGFICKFCSLIGAVHLITGQNGTRNPPDVIIAGREKRLVPRIAAGFGCPTGHRRKVTCQSRAVQEKSWFTPMRTGRMVPGEASHVSTISLKINDNFLRSFNRTPNYTPKINGCWQTLANCAVAISATKLGTPGEALFVFRPPFIYR